MKVFATNVWRSGGGGLSFVPVFEALLTQLLGACTKINTYENIKIIPTRSAF